MGGLPRVDEEELELLATYQVGEDQAMTTAVVNAFLAAKINVFEESTQLVDWINPDAVDSLRWTDENPLSVATAIWNHNVVITADEIRIYARN